MKLGYKIIIALLVAGAFFYLKSVRDHKLERFEQKVKKLITDIRHRDYFAFQQELLPELTKRVSIESIQRFMEPLKIKRDVKVELASVKEQNSTSSVAGYIYSQTLKLPYNMVFKEHNRSRLLLLSISIGNSTLQKDEEEFPIIQKR